MDIKFNNIVYTKIREGLRKGMFGVFKLFA